MSSSNNAGTFSRAHDYVVATLGIAIIAMAAYLTIVQLAI